MSWSTKDIPSQAGKLAVVTGATGGLGYETALELARAGAEVVVTGRNPQKGAEALRRIKAEVKGAKVTYDNLDLSALANVKAFAETFSSKHDKLDILVNNAGVMMPPARRMTADGFELQFGTNHLAHFALTASLLPLLAAARGRVVTVSSVAHRMGQIRFDDIDWTRNYSPTGSYAQSKLANLLFAQELQRRSDAKGWNVTSIAAHPGISSTDLVANGPGGNGFLGWLTTVSTRLMGQPPSRGALSQLYAATNPEARPGGYFGPDGLLEYTGSPHPARIAPAGRDQAVGERLWQLSEQLTNTRFALEPLPA